MKHRQSNKSSGSERSPGTGADDVAKRTGGARGGSAGCSSRVLSATGYVTVVCTAGLLAFYLQGLLEETRQLHAESRKTLHNITRLSEDMSELSLQVEAMKQTFVGLESAQVSVRAELDATGRVQRQSEAETRRLEEALQLLQKQILADLSQGIRDAKEARQLELSSLERAVEERLAELGGSIGDGVAAVTGTQVETQARLRELQERLESLARPAQLQQEVIAQLQAADRAMEKTTESLLGQIVAVGAELQTRNQEVASQSDEIASVRDVFQSTISGLRERAQSVEMSLEQASSGLQNLQTELHAALQRLESGREETQARLRALEEAADHAHISSTELEARVETALAKQDSLDHRLTALTRDSEVTRVAVEKLQAGEKEVLVEQVQQLREAQAERLQSLEEKQATMGGSLEQLRTAVDSLVLYSVKIEQHQEDITELQKNLARTHAAMERLVEVPKVLDVEE